MNLGYLAEIYEHPQLESISICFVPIGATQSCYFMLLTSKKSINFLAASCILRLLSVVLRMMVSLGNVKHIIENKIKTRDQSYIGGPEGCERSIKV